MQNGQNSTRRCWTLNVVTSPHPVLPSALSLIPMDTFDRAISIDIFEIAISWYWKLKTRPFQLLLLIASTLLLSAFILSMVSYRFDCSQYAIELKQSIRRRILKSYTLIFQITLSQMNVIINCISSGNVTLLDNIIYMYVRTHVLPTLFCLQFCFSTIHRLGFTLVWNLRLTDSPMNI